MAGLALTDALHLSDAYLARGQIDQANAVLARVVDAGRGAPPTGANLRAWAGALLRMGDLAAAIRVFIRALAADPAHRDEAEALAATLAEMGHPDAAPLQRAVEQAHLADYQRGVEALRRSRYVDFPRHVHLETLARCNAACTFCAYPNLDRRGARLDDTTLAKVIDELTEIPRDLPFQLSPFKVNEPLLDVRLFDLLDTVRARLPHARVTLTTNASALTEDKARKLGALPHLERLYVSFNDHRPAAYEAAMNLPYDRTVQRLDTLHRVKASGGFVAPVTLSRVGDGTPADQAFRAFVRDRWPGFASLVLRRGDWLGSVDTAVAAVPAVGCMRWFELSITATGSVAHCCMDGNNQYPIGDAAREHVLAIYNRPSFRQLRVQALDRRAASPCAGCTFL
jgi:tetratricopeptide (TPR) repeat protein